MNIVLSGRRTLVFGGGGFIGRRVVSLLLSAGAYVRVADLIGQTQAGVLEHPNLIWMQGDIRDDSFIRKAAKNCDSVIFLASSSLPATANADFCAEISGHVLPPVRVAELCQSEGVRTLVFSSSGGTVYGIDSLAPLKEDAPTRPKNAYGVSKLMIEHYLRILASLRDIRTVSLRISNPYGPGQLATRGQGFVAAAMRHAYSGETLSIWGDGSTVRDFIYVDDLARAIAHAIAYSGDKHVMNIGSGVGQSLLEIIRKIETATGHPVRVVFESSRPIDVAHNVLDIGLSQQELGWSPSTSIDEGLALTAAWWKKERMRLAWMPG